MGKDTLKIDGVEIEIDDTYLLMVAKNLPSSPPLKTGGDVTVREMHPNLTEEQLDFVMAHYPGSMERG